jgi:hypothetical protein
MAEWHSTCARILKGDEKDAETPVGSVSRYASRISHAEGVKFNGRDRDREFDVPK